MRKPPREPKQAVLDHQVRVFREIGGPLPLDEPALRERLGLAYDRGRSCIRFRRLDDDKLELFDRIIKYTGSQYPESRFYGTYNGKARTS